MVVNWLVVVHGSLGEIHIEDNCSEQVQQVSGMFCGERQILLYIIALDASQHILRCLCMEVRQLQKPVSSVNF